MIGHQISVSLALAALLVTGLSTIASAADKLRVGKPVATSFSYVPLDVGISQGIFVKHGIEIEELNFSGAAPMESAMVSGSLDIGLSASAMLAHLVKGSPETAVAVNVISMANLGIMVPYDSPLKGIDDLKGKSIGITTVGSLSDWLVRMLNGNRGWIGADQAKAIAIGSTISVMTAALKTHQVDGIVGDIGLVFEFEDAKEARLLVPVSDYVGNLPREIIYVSNSLIEANPGLVRRFLAAWFETVAFMKSNKAETVPAAAKVEQLTIPYEGKMYDLAISMFSDDGKFDTAGLAAVRKSFVDMKLLESEPDLSPYFTERFLPSNNR